MAHVYKQNLRYPRREDEMALDWFPVFRTGKHTDSNGNEKEWTRDDLNKIVSSYDPSHHEAPVVIGHPKDNAPAWGWVEALKREGDILLAKPARLVSDFVDMLKKGMFKKRSISLYPDGSLRHIGFLGAMPPAVKGLEDIQFNEGGETTIEFEEMLSPSHSHPESRGGEGRGTEESKKEDKTMKFFDWLKSLAQKEGVQLDDLPATFSEADVRDAAAKAAQEARDKAAAEFAEQQKKKDSEIAERERKLKEKEASYAKKAVSEFCEGLKKQGVLTPAMDKIGMGITEFMHQISAIGTTVEFGEGDAKGKQTPLEFMQGFLAKLPKAIEFREVAGNEKDTGKSGNAGERLGRLVSEKMKANKELTYGAAFAEVQEENPELAAEYAEDMKGGK
jgi:hypothetical protein